MTKISAHQLIESVLDDGSFRSWDDPPSQPDFGAGYAKQLQRARARSGVDESILTGEGTLAGQRVALILGEFGFLAGSTGYAASKRIVLAFERASSEGLPLIASPISGGTRVQEGTQAFLQLIQISHAVRAYRRTGRPYLVYLRNPTTGGPLVSWGSLGHVTLAEPNALIGLLGPRVREALTGERMPEGVQGTENLAEFGIVDRVVPINELREEVSQILRILTPPHIAVKEEPTRTLPVHAPQSAQNQNHPAWHSVEATNKPERPRLHNLIEFEANFYAPLLGTGSERYRGAISVGLARFNEFSCILIGHQRETLPGRDLTFDGLQAAQRGFRIADELNLPLVTVIDTPGVEISVDSEQRGMAREIARTVEALVDVKAPVISVILGAGTGVSALSLLPADRTVSAENAWVAPLPLDGASEILHRSPKYAPQIAEEQGIRAVDLSAAGAVDEIVAEFPGAADEPANFCRRLLEAITIQLRDVLTVSPEARLRDRAQRFRSMY